MAKVVGKGKKRKPGREYWEFECAEMWEKCEKAKGAWIGWGGKGTAAHGISL